MLSLLLSVVMIAWPVSLGLARRIAVEERVLAEELGEEHARWCERTWRLLPFVW